MLAPRPCVTEEDRQQEEIAQAKASGLQVAFGSMNVGREAGMFSFNVAGGDDTNVDDLFKSDADANNDGGGKTEEVPFDEEAAYRQNMEGGIGLDECESDSDDDLL